jgi:hypothetical protein
VKTHWDFAGRAVCGAAAGSKRSGFPSKVDCARCLTALKHREERAQQARKALS